MAHITRAQILGADDLTKEDVEVPEWGGTVTIRTMTGAERDAWEQSLVAPGGGKVDMSNVRARLVSFCAVDENGARLFTDADAVALGAKSGAALERCAKVAQQLNALTVEALEAARKN